MFIVNHAKKNVNTIFKESNTVHSKCISIGQLNFDKIDFLNEIVS